jgi:hypothetical protein
VGYTDGGFRWLGKKKQVPNLEVVMLYWHDPVGSVFGGCHVIRMLEVQHQIFNAYSGRYYIISKFEQKRWRKWDF